MAQAWQTLEEAALTLGISLRTLHRRLSRGELQTRMENGRREVLVVVSDFEPTADERAAAAAAVRGLADASARFETQEDMLEGVSDDTQQTVLALHEDRVRRTDLAIMAYQQSVMVTAADARRAITRSRVAWGVAGGLTVALFLTAIWATHTVTRAEAQVGHLSDNVRQLTADAESKSREVKSLRSDTEAAKLSAARAEGQLAAAKAQIEQLRQDQQETAARLASATLSAAPATQPIPLTTAATQPAATTQPARN